MVSILPSFTTKLPLMILKSTWPGLVNTKASTRLKWVPA